MWISNPLVHFSIRHFPCSFSWSPGKIRFPSYLQWALHTPSMQPSARVFLITGTDDPKHRATQSRISNKIFIFKLRSHTFERQLEQASSQASLKYRHLHYWGQQIASIDYANFIRHRSHQTDLVVV